jgi:hypothetical protein
MTIFSDSAISKPSFGGRPNSVTTKEHRGLNPSSTSLHAGTCISQLGCSQCHRCSFMSLIRISFPSRRLHKFENVAADEQPNSRYFPLREFRLVEISGTWLESQSRFPARQLLGSRNRLAQRAEGHAASGRHRQRTENRTGRPADKRPDCRASLFVRQARGSHRYRTNWQNRSARGRFRSQARTLGPKKRIHLARGKRSEERSEHLYDKVRTPTSLRCLNKSSGSW